MKNLKLADRGVDWRTRMESCSSRECAKGYEIQMGFDETGRFVD